MRYDLRFLTRTAVLLALTVAAQLFSGRLGQMVTGPLVNAMLYISAYSVGWIGGVIIGAVTPWVALAYGIVKAPAVPAVPFIMIANAILVLVFAGVSRLNKTWGRYPAVVVAAVVKFAVLAGAVQYILNLKPAVAAAFGVPQLVTALIGGAGALLVIEALERVTAPRPAAKNIPVNKE